MTQAISSRKLVFWSALLAVLVIGIGAVAIASSSSDRASTEALEGGPTSEPVQTLSSQSAASFPVLAKSRDTVESGQQGLVAKAVALLERQALAGKPGANAALARAYYESDGDAGYLVPAGAGTLCTVQIYQGELLGMGCGEEADLSRHGTVSVRVVQGGYDVSGLLPKGTGEASITLAGHATTVKADEYGGFDLATKVWPEKVAYRLPGGGESVQTMSPPPAPAKAG